MPGRARTPKPIDDLDEPSTTAPTRTGTSGAHRAPLPSTTYEEERLTKPAMPSYPMLRDSTTMPLSGESLESLEARAAASQPAPPLPRPPILPGDVVERVIDADDVGLFHLEDDSARLLEAMNGTANVAKLARALRLGEGRARSLVAELVDAGLARVR